MVFMWMAAGFALRRARVPPRVFVGLTHFIVWVPLSAMIVRSMHAFAWDASYWAPASAAWLVFAGSAALFAVLGRRRRWSARVTGALVLTAGLSNTVFVGYALLRALEGEGAVSIAVRADQPGTFLLLMTLALATASYYSMGRPDAGAVFKRLARFPPSWALLAGLLSRGWEFSPALTAALAAGGRILAPLALISIGARLRFDPALIRREREALAWGLGYKLVLAPAGIALLFAGFFGRGGETVRVAILESALGPMIVAATIVEENGLDASLSSLMMGVGTPLCLITVTLWAKILDRFGI